MRRSRVSSSKGAISSIGEASEAGIGESGHALRDRLHGARPEARVGAGGAKRVVLELPIEDGAGIGLTIADDDLAVVGQLDLGRVAPDIGAVRAQHLDLVGRFRELELGVPHVGVAGDAAERLLLADAADHDGHPRLDRGRSEAQPVGTVARALVRDLLTGHQRAHDLESLLEPVETVAEAAPELEPEGGVLTLVPAAAQPEDGAAAADVVDGGDGLGHDGRIAEGVGTDEEPESDMRRHRGPGGQARIALEDGPVRIAHGRDEVVPGPEMVVAELVDPPRSGQVRRPVRVLGPQLDPESDGRHVLTPSWWRARGWSAPTAYRADRRRGRAPSRPNDGFMDPRLGLATRR